MLPLKPLKHSTANQKSESSPVAKTSEAGADPQRILVSKLTLAFTHLDEGAVRHSEGQ